MKYLIDAWAWVAYLEGGKAGEQVNEILNSGNEIYTLNLTITEVIAKAKRSGKDVEVAYKAIINNSATLDLNPESAKKSGILYIEMRNKNESFGMIDAILLLTARELRAKILTGDEHFKGMKEAILLK